MASTQALAPEGVRRSPMSGSRCIAGLLALAVWWSGLALAGNISVPNNSFESPATGFVSININSWQKTPKPDWYDDGGGIYLWEQLTGIFKNTPTNSADHIDNCDSNQVMWLFVVPEVGLFQDYDSVDWNDPAPTHDFDALYEVGKSYQLTVGIIGTGGGMQQGTTLELSLYYRDGPSNKVAVASTSVTNLSSIFSNNTHLIDFTVNVPTVQAGDAWAGEHIGIQILSTVSTNLQGGYWDLDNVRLTSFQSPVLLSPLITNGQFQITLESEPGLGIEILSSTNFSQPLSNWVSLATLTNLTGTIPFIDSDTNFQQRFYQARQLP